MSVNNVAKSIRAKLSELKINQEQLAEMLGIKQGLLSQYKNGVRNPKIDFYNKWKEIFNEDLSELPFSVPTSAIRTGSNRALL